MGSPFSGTVETVVAIAVLAAWFGSEAYFRYRSRGADAVTPPSQSRDRGSLHVVFGGVFASILVSCALWFNGLGRSPISTFWVGVGVMLLGIGIRSWAIASLGRFFSLSVQLRPDHEIVQNGPYRWVRHPAYTGALLTLLGFPILIGDVVAILVVGGVLGLAFGYRIGVEERALKERFGDAYRSYERRTWRLVPPLV